MDFNQCPCSGKSLARLIQPAVMAVLSREPLHGYVVVQRLKAMAMFREQGPDVTGVYRLLRSMEKRGFVTSSWDTSASGPARRLYTLTKDGRSCLKRWTATLRKYLEAVSDLLRITETGGAGPAKEQRSRRAAGERKGKR